MYDARNNRARADGFSVLTVASVGNTGGAGPTASLAIVVCTRVCNRRCRRTRRRCCIACNNFGGFGGAEPNRPPPLTYDNRNIVFSLHDDSRLSFTMRFFLSFFFFSILYRRHRHETHTQIVYTVIFVCPFLPSPPSVYDVAASVVNLFSLFPTSKRFAFFSEDETYA